MLRLTPALEAAGQRVQAELFIAEMCVYLVDDCQVADKQSPELEELCRSAYARGIELGLTQKSSLLMFGWLVHETDGQALNSPEIEAALTEPGADPEWAMDQILNTVGLMARAEV